MIDRMELMRRIEQATPEDVREVQGMIREYLEDRPDGDFGVEMAACSIAMLASM